MSPFNQPIPANPRLNPRSTRIVRRLVGFGPPNPERVGLADKGDDYSKPVYFARPGDPLVTLDGSSSSPIDGRRIHVPSGARPAASGDAHMTIVEADGWEYDLYDAHQASRGKIRYDSGRRIRVDGDGLRSAATASRFGSLAGRVGAAEMEAGQINHALFMVVQCTSGRYVWPAAKTDSRCRNPADAPPMGARFQLAMSDGQIAALGVPAWKKTILRALAHYGAYVGDSTSSPWSVTGFESGSTYTSFGLQDPMVAFARRAGIRPNGDGVYVFDIKSGVDWERYLRVIDPSVARSGPRSRSVAPRVSSVSINPRRVRSRGTIRYRLSRAATVTFSFVRGGRRWVGSFTDRGHAGPNRKRFSGRLLGGRLRAGSYKATLVATDGTGRSKPRSTRFRVKRR